MARRLTETLIQETASPESFRRGQGYHQSGAVLASTRSDDLFVALVMESLPPPYTVEIVFDNEGSVVASDCTCLSDRDSWCEHVVAALLAYLEEPEAT